jgi:hypothetical protein
MPPTFPLSAARPLLNTLVASCLFLHIVKHVRMNTKTLIKRNLP